MSVGGRVDGRVWLREPQVSLGSSGPSRVDTSRDDPEPKLPPLGFTSRENWEAAQAEEIIEPLLWEGD